jgi:hypothetical protein|tara:strand:- start:8933 stop:9196 length:264 start_codon:yes stop_codon:yes gene_type:complete
MTTDSEVDMSINVAVYMERLDNYIASQTAINDNICRTLDSLNSQLDDINTWRSKVYGAKSGILGIAFLVVHTSAVLGSFAAITKWIN